MWIWKSDGLVSSVGVVLVSYVSSIFAELQITVDSTPKPFYDVNDNVILKCSGGSSYSWSRKKTPDWAVEDSKLILPQVFVPGANTLNFNGIRATDGGTYICNDTQTGTNVEFTLNVLAKESIVPSNENYTSTREATLRCYQRFNRTFPIIWYFPNGTQVNSTNVENNKQDRSAVIKDNYDLILSSALRYPAKTGQYRCRINATGALNDSDANLRLDQYTVNKLNKLEQKVDYDAAPDVTIQGSGKSKSAIKGEGFVLNCTIQGHAKGTDHVRWVHQNDETNVVTVLLDAPWSSLDFCADSTDADKKKCCPSGSLNCNASADHIHFSRDQIFEDDSASGNHSSGHAQNFVSSLLTIKDVKEEDGGTYNCSSRNEHGWSSASVKVRVKDRLAALWPFIGIVIEVIVLCAIIFVCERRRSKTVEEEDETEPMKGEEKVDRDTSVRSRK